MDKFLSCYILFALVIILSLCGYMENDDVIFKKQVCGNFFLLRNENSNYVSLVQYDGRSGYTFISERLSKAYLDNSKLTVYCKEKIYDSNYQYSSVRFFDTAGTSFSAYQKNSISKNVFDSFSFRRLIFSDTLLTE